MTIYLKPYVYTNDDHSFEAYWAYEFGALVGGDKVIAAVWRTKTGPYSKMFYACINYDPAYPGVWPENSIANAETAEECIALLNKTLIDGGYEMLTEERIAKLGILL